MRNTLNKEVQKAQENVEKERRSQGWLFEIIGCSRCDYFFDGIEWFSRLMIRYAVERETPIASATWSAVRNCIGVRTGIPMPIHSGCWMLSGWKDPHCPALFLWIGPYRYSFHTSCGFCLSAQSNRREVTGCAYRMYGRSSKYSLIPTIPRWMIFLPGRVCHSFQMYLNRMCLYICAI